MDQKDTHTSTKDQKDTLKTKDGLCRYVFLKLEKLTSALYMITDFLSDNEPLKWKLRELSLDLVFETKSLPKDRKDFFGVAGLGRVSLGLDNLITLLDVAYVGGTVSQMNLAILKQEYQMLFDLINIQLSESSLKKFISDEGVSTYPALVASPIGRPNPTPIRYIGQKDIKPDTVNDLYGLNSKTAKKSLRKEQIINFLKDKSWTGITEISKALPNCGSKTVQRELLEMVSLNILKKQGERRWSKYMLM